MSLKHQNPTKEKPQQSRVRNARIVPKQTMGFSTPNLTQENPFKYRSFELRIRKGRALKICKLQTRKIFQKKKNIKIYELEPPKSYKGQTLNNSLKSCKRKNPQNLWAYNPKILQKKNTFKICELETQKSFTAQRAWNPKILKVSDLKTREPYTGKTLQIYELQTSNLTKNKPSHSASLNAQKNVQKNTFKNYELKHSISYKEKHSKSMGLKLQNLTKKPFQTYELKPLKLQPKKKQKICEPKSRCLTWAFNWGVDIHPQKTKRCQQGSRGQNLSGAVWATISENIKTRLGEGPFHGGGPFGEWH